MEKETLFFMNPSEKHFITNAGDRCPLGIMSLSSFMTSKGYITKIFDLNHSSEEQMLDEAKKNNSKYFCISIATPLYRKAIELAQRIRREIPCACLIAGGNHVTDMPQEPLTLMTFNHIIIGDGEDGLLRIVRGEARDKIVYSKPIEDLNQLPMPDYEGVCMEKYTMLIEGKAGAVISTSRGCLFNCSFCGDAVSFSKLKMKKYRERSPENVVQELEVLHHKYGMHAFWFGDEIFTYNRARVMELCGLIRKKLPMITWRAMTRADLVDEELLHEMKLAGCNILCFGIESGNDAVLKNIQKGMTKKQNQQAVEWCHKVGIKVKGFFIFPLPGDTEETFIETLSFAKSLRLEYCDIYPFAPYPGTLLWNNAEKFGLKIIKPENDNWDDYYQVGKQGAHHELKFQHPNFTHERIMELIIEFQREIGIPGLTYK